MNTEAPVRTPAQRHRWGLFTYEDVRRQLAAAIRKVQAGDMDPKTGSALASMYRTLMDALERGDYDERISDLEGVLAKLRADYEALKAGVDT